MAKPVHNQCMYAWVSSKHLKMATRSWVALKHDRDIFFNMVKHDDLALLNGFQMAKIDDLIIML